ncbi:Chitin synthase, class 2 [Thoreauomyces humboldtii]|nr:Chitin synthase, class 2 [Thoreauomyces humboldtii]
MLEGAPSPINVLQIYVFCNLHDVSWGTKGDDEGSDLPTVHVVQNADDLEAAWSSGIEERRHFNASDVGMWTPVLLRKTHTRLSARTYLGWLGSNMILFGVITQTSNKLADKYIVYLLFATAGLAAIRILGVVLYQLSRVVHGLLSSCSSTKEAKKASRNSVPPSAPPGFTVIGNRYNGFEVVKDDKATGSPSIFLGA